MSKLKIIGRHFLLLSFTIYLGVSFFGLSCGNLPSLPITDISKVKKVATYINLGNIIIIPVLIFYTYLCFLECFLKKFPLLTLYPNTLHEQQLRGWTSEYIRRHEVPDWMVSPILLTSNVTASYATQWIIILFLGFCGLLCVFIYMILMYLPINFYDKNYFSVILLYFVVLIFGVTAGQGVYMLQILGYSLYLDYRFMY